MDRKNHWDRIFTHRHSSELTWYQPQLKTSLELISALHLTPKSRIIDSGSGDSNLVDDLLAYGFTSLTVLDVSAVALERSRSRLGNAAALVEWICGDILEVDLGERSFYLWHDRALFHFLVDPAERQHYLHTLDKSLAECGYWLVATFAPQGPEICSGLSTLRYKAEELSELLGKDYRLISTCHENHARPQGGEQAFIYCCFQKYRGISALEEHPSRN